MDRRTSATRREGATDAVARRGSIGTRSLYRRASSCRSSPNFRPTAARRPDAGVSRQTGFPGWSTSWCGCSRRRHGIGYCARRATIGDSCGAPENVANVSTTKPSDDVTNSPDIHVYAIRRPSGDHAAWPPQIEPRRRGLPSFNGTTQRAHSAPRSSGRNARASWRASDTSREYVPGRQRTVEQPSVLEIDKHAASLDIGHDVGAIGRREASLHPAVMRHSDIPCHMWRRRGGARARTVPPEESNCEPARRDERNPERAAEALATPSSSDTSNPETFAGSVDSAAVAASSRVS